MCYVCVCVLITGGGGGGGMGGMSMDRMGSGFDRMGMSGMDMNRGFGGGYGHMGGGMSDRGSGSKAGCQIFVRNVSVGWICANVHVESYSMQFFGF